MAKAKGTSDGTIELSRLVETAIDVPIIGKTPLIPHRWSEKSKRMMPGHPDKDKVKSEKGVRKPEEEAGACLYMLGQDYAMPATAFKAAIVGACRFFEKPTMVEAKQLFFVEGEGSEQLVRIECSSKELHEDTCRNSNGSADLRYRYYLTDWKAKLTIRFVPRLVSDESIIALVDAAGRGGVGDWRPSAPKSFTGTYGTWGVDDSGEMGIVASPRKPKPKKARA